MKIISEFDLAKAIFTRENHEEICKKAEILSPDLTNSSQGILDKYERTRDIMWDQEQEKQEVANFDGAELYNFIDVQESDGEESELDFSDLDEEEDEDGTLESILGFGPILVEPKQTIFLLGTPHVIFKPTRLLVSD